MPEPYVLALISAGSAILGALVGGTVTGLAAWLLDRERWKREDARLKATELRLATQEFSSFMASQLTAASEGMPLEKLESLNGRTVAFSTIVPEDLGVRALSWARAMLALGQGVRDGTSTSPLVDAAMDRQTEFIREARKVLGTS